MLCHRNNRVQSQLPPNHSQHSHRISRHYSCHAFQLLNSPPNSLRGLHDSELRCNIFPDF